MPALTFSHIGITVPDLEKAVEFYTKAFGFYQIMGPTEIQHDESAIGVMCDDVFGEGWGSFRIAHLSKGDGIGIELFENDVKVGPTKAERADRGSAWLVGRLPRLYFGLHAEGSRLKIDVRVRNLDIASGREHLVM